MDHIEDKFPSGESLKDVENRIGEFIKFLKENYYGKTGDWQPGWEYIIK